MASYTRIAAASALVVGLAACGSSATATHAPPAGTPAATHAPAGRSQASAEQIATRLHLADQAGYVAYTAGSDPNHLLGRQNGYVSKVNWGDPNEVDLWGSIEVFSSHAALVARAQEVSSVAPPFGDGYDFTAGNALLRLGAPYSPAKAAALGAQFRAAR